MIKTPRRSHAQKQLSSYESTNRTSLASSDWWPIPRKRPEPSGRYLGLDERLQIADLRLAGIGVRAIAIQLGRSPSTISRELTRNGPVPGARGRGK